MVGSCIVQLVDGLWQFTNLVIENNEIQLSDTVKGFSFIQLPSHIFYMQTNMSLDSTSYWTFQFMSFADNLSWLFILFHCQQQQQQQFICVSPSPSSLKSHRKNNLLQPRIIYKINYKIFKYIFVMLQT